MLFSFTTRTTRQEDKGIEQLDRRHTAEGCGVTMVDDCGRSSKRVVLRAIGCRRPRLDRFG